MKKNLNIAYLNGAEGVTRKSSTSSGGNVSLMKEVTYAELKELRDGGKLVPGQMYRMTDYETTTSQEGTQAAGHPFDLILTALDEKTLDEKCSAIWSERDVDGYFANSNLAAWEVWYCLDNDIERFNWAEFSGLIISVDFSDWDDGIVTALYDGTFTFTDGKEYYKWYIPSWGAHVLTTNKEPNIGDATIFVVIDNNGEIEHADNGGDVSSITNSKGSKGVIYRMIDENRNDLPYDFKNIMFTRKITDGKLDTEGGTDTFVYTFNYFNDSVCGDCTIVNPSRCTMNHISISTSLPNNVFLNDRKSYCYSNTLTVACYDNTFCENCYNNTFDNNCEYNIFGDGCGSNTFGKGCGGNTFGENCHNNTFGISCNSNTFVSNCYNNKFGNSSSLNTLGDRCSDITLGSICENNIFGDGCNSNILGDKCHKNTFGDGCYYNTFGVGCDSNTFGKGCGDNTFYDECDTNVLGDYCGSSTFWYECHGNTLDASYSKNIELKCNVDNIKLSANGNGSHSNYVRNYEIKNIEGIYGSPTEIMLTRNNVFTTYISKSSNGDIIQYTDEDIYNAINK